MSCKSTALVSCRKVEKEAARKASVRKRRYRPECKKRASLQFKELVCFPSLKRLCVLTYLWN